jgi:hypothetical protein
MGYVVVVLAQTLVLPLIFTVATLGAHDVWTVVGTFGHWSLFWAIGTRLLLAGIVQVVKPEYTTETIHGEKPSLAAQELGFANVAMGIGGIVGTFVGGALAAAITGGLYMGIAGVRHLGNRGMNARERVATWTDLLVFGAMAGYALALLR